MCNLTIRDSPTMKCPAEIFVENLPIIPIGNVSDKGATKQVGWGFVLENSVSEIRKRITSGLEL